MCEYNDLNRLYTNVVLKGRNAPIPPPRVRAHARVCYRIQYQV